MLKIELIILKVNKSFFYKLYKYNIFFRYMKEEMIKIKREDYLILLDYKRKDINY